jgi:hypothetical protein
MSVSIIDTVYRNGMENFPYVVKANVNDVVVPRFHSAQSS